jgi:hypothetical protein
MSPRERRQLLRFLLAGTALPLLPRHGLAAAPSAIHELEGRVLVNGRPATPSTAVRAGDRVHTGADGRLVLSTGGTALLLRGNTELELREESGFGGVLRLVTGALLAVFGRGSARVETPTATVGIRGTGTYFEVAPGETYLCTCYGSTDMQAAANPAVRDNVSTRHHEAPRLIRDTAGGPVIVAAGVRNHSDAELILLESTVGRRVPFDTGGGYNGY